MYYVVCVHLGQNFSLVNILQSFTTETTPCLSAFVAVKSGNSCVCCCGSIILNLVIAVEVAVEDHSKVDRNRNRNRNRTATATATATKTATAFRALAQGCFKK